MTLNISDYDREALDYSGEGIPNAPGIWNNLKSNHLEIWYLDNDDTMTLALSSDLELPPEILRDALLDMISIYGGQKIINPDITIH